MSKDTSTLIDGWSAFPTLTKCYATSAIGFTARLPLDSAIREYTITLYVGLAHAFPPTNTKFRPLLLPTQWVCHTQALTSTEHHISSLQSHFRGQLSAGVLFCRPTKTGNSCGSSSSTYLTSRSFLFQFRWDFSALRKPILLKFISMGSCFPEVRSLDILNKSTVKVTRLIICKKL